VTITPDTGRPLPIDILLKGYDQVLLADAYGGYNGMVAGNGIVCAGWAREIACIQPLRDFLHF
jgi:hypothetical protein